MSELLVVANPKRRKKARRRKMSALQRKYFGKRRHRRRRAHHAEAPRRRRRRHHARRRARRTPVGTRFARGYTVGTRPIRRRKLNPHHRRRHHFRRRHHNPISVRGLTSQFMPTVKAGGVGAVGALALDGVWGFVNYNLPTLSGYLTNPYIALAAKYALAVGVGGLGGKFWRGRGRELAIGGATVVTHDFLKTLLQQMAPTIFGPQGSFPLGSYLSSYLSGAAPIVGTATFPKAYYPWSNRLGGPSGAVDDSPGVYAADAYGFDPWAGGSLDANTPWY